MMLSTITLIQNAVLMSTARLQAVATEVIFLDALLFTLRAIGMQRLVAT